MRLFAKRWFRDVFTFSRHRAFRWEDASFVPIYDVDYENFSNLLGIDNKISILKANTEQFLYGYPANNVLLWGPRGTGKSSCIKALYGHYKSLRIIEVTRGGLVNINHLLKCLRHSKYKFIIYCDDLSFEKEEHMYRQLKSVLEGGLEKRPENVLIYATSNRRHLMPENVTDNELHERDSMEEKVSLSDRFGIKIGFISFDSTTYLEIVKNYSKERGILIDEKTLCSKAMQWALSHGAYTGRGARQFVDNLKGHMLRGDMKNDYKRPAPSGSKKTRR